MRLTGGTEGRPRGGRRRGVPDVRTRGVAETSVHTAETNAVDEADDTAGEVPT